MKLSVCLIEFEVVMCDLGERTSFASLRFFENDFGVFKFVCV